MSDNIQLNPGAGGQIISTDDIGGGVSVQRVKIQFGIDGFATDVSILDALPITVVNFPVTQPVSILVLPLPTGAATSAKQDTGNTSLSSIDGKLPALSGGRVPVEAIIAGNVEIVNDVGNPIPISASVLPLPTGAATEAGNLATIAAKDFATQTTLALVKAKTDNLDLATTALRDALRGASNKTLTDIDTDLGTLHTDLGVLLTQSDFDTKTGSLTEAAPATDTASSGLNGRLQRIAQRITSLIAATLAISIADGSNIVEGAVADAIVAAGASGTLSAKLRRVTQGLEDLKTTIVIAAGSNLIGKVGIDQTTPGTTNKVTVGTDVIHTIVDSTNIGKAEDSVSVDGDTGVMSLGIRQDIPVSDTSATQDYQSFKTDAQGRMWVNSDVLGNLLNNNGIILSQILVELKVITQILSQGLNVNDNPEMYRNDPILNVV